MSYQEPANIQVAGNIATAKTEDPLTRSEALKKIIDYFKVNGSGNISNYFDIPLSDTNLQAYAATAEKLNLIRGSYLYPDKIITRGEFIELINRLGKLKQSPNTGAVYSDVPSTNSLYEAIQNYAYTRNIKSGTF